MVDHKRFEFYHTWYHSVIREIVTSVDFSEDYQFLGRLVKPEISAKQARHSVALLLDLGLIAKRKNRYYLTHNSLIANSTADTVALRKNQTEVMEMGIAALEKFPKSDRNIFTQNIGVSHENAERINTILTNMQKQIIAIANMEQPVETVKQLNIQYFPMSKNLTSKRGLQ